MSFSAGERVIQEEQDGSKLHHVTCWEDECLRQHWVGENTINFSHSQQGVILNNVVLIIFRDLFVCRREQMIPSLFVSLIQKNAFLADSLFCYLKKAFDDKKIDFSPNIYINQLVYGLSLAGQNNLARKALMANKTVCGYRVETRYHQYDNGWDCIRDAFMSSSPSRQFTVEETCYRDGLFDWYSEGVLEHRFVKGIVKSDVSDLDVYLSENVFTPEEQLKFSRVRSLIAPLNSPPHFQFLIKAENRSFLKNFYRSLDMDCRENLIQMILFYTAAKRQFDALDQLLSVLEGKPIRLFTPDRFDWQSITKEQQFQYYAWLKMMLFAVAQAGDEQRYKQTYDKIRCASIFRSHLDTLKIHAVLYAAYGGHVKMVYTLIKAIMKSTAISSSFDHHRVELDKFVRRDVIGALRQVGVFLDSYSRQLILPLLHQQTLLDSRSFRAGGEVVMRLSSRELQCAASVSRLNPQNLLSLSPQQMNLFFAISGNRSLRFWAISFLVEVSKRLSNDVPQLQMHFNGKCYHHPLIALCFSPRLSRLARLRMTVSFCYRNYLEQRMESFYHCFNAVMGNRVLACLIWSFLSDIPMQTVECMAAKGVFATKLTSEPSLEDKVSLTVFNR